MKDSASFMLIFEEICIILNKRMMKMTKRTIMMENRKFKKPLKKYYQAYYNGNFMRDFRFIPDNKKKYNEVFNEKKLGAKGKAESRALHFLTKAEHIEHDGLLGGEISYFKSRQAYHSGDILQRWSDRQFFDIDIESDAVSILKDDFKKAYDELNGIELSERIEELQSDFRDLIFNEDILYPTFSESRKLCLYLEDLGLRPYQIFSGSKGFHINIFYDECRLQNLSQVSRLFAKSFSDKLDLRYLDWAVFDKKKAQRRLQRCQYAFHSKTNLLTLPIPEVYDYDDFLDIIEKNDRHPIDFDFQEYSSQSGEFRESLIKNDKEFQRINERRQRELKKQNEERRKEMMKKYHGKYKDFKDIPMIELYSHYGGEIIKEDSSKAIVRCLFHGADKNPSAVIFKDSNYFHCSSCGKTLNYYGLISEMEGTEDKHEIMQKAEEFLR